MLCTANAVQFLHQGVRSAPLLQHVTHQMTSYRATEWEYQQWGAKWARWGEYGSAPPRRRRAARGAAGSGAACSASCRRAHPARREQPPSLQQQRAGHRQCAAAVAAVQEAGWCPQRGGVESSATPLVEMLHDDRSHQALEMPAEHLGAWQDGLSGGGCVEGRWHPVKTMVVV